MVSNDSDLRVLTFVSAPLVPQITTPVRNITTINATTLAIKSEYRNATLDELPKNNKTWAGVHNNGLGVEVRVAFYGQNDLEWSFSVFNLSDGTNRSVRGRTYYCVAQCQWKKEKNENALVLETYTTSYCSPFSLGAPSYPSTAGIAHALFSDIMDRPSRNVLYFAYVAPAMYATIVLGGWDYLWRNLTRIAELEPVLTNTLNSHQTLEALVVESNKRLLAYIVLIVLIFIALWISEFVDTKVFVSEWAPLWFGLLSNSEQEEIRKQILGNLGLDGLREIGSEYIPLTSNGLEETKES